MRTPLLLAALAACTLALPPVPLAAQQPRNPIAASDTTTDVCTDLEATPKARVDACRAAVKARKDDPKAHELLGHALEAAEKYDDAVDSYERAVKLQPGNPHLYVDLRDAYVGQRKFDEARAALERGLRANPDSAAAHSAVARWFAEEEVWDTALVHVDHAVKLAPRTASLHDLRGDVLYGLDRNADALAAYRQAAKLDPNYRPAQMGIAMILRTQKKWADAVAAYDVAIRLDPKEVWAYRQKAIIQADEMKKPGDGLRTLQALVKAAPDNDESHYELAAFLRQHDRAAEALPHIRQAIQLDTADAGDRRELGLVLEALGKPEEALAAYQQAIATNPEYHVVYGNAFDVLTELKRFEDALKMADEWKKRAPKEEAGPYVARGIALRFLERNGEARRALDGALDRDSTNVTALINRGIVLLGDRRFEEAGRDADAIMRLAPDIVNGYALAGFVALAQERCPDVVRYWTRANQVEPGWVDRNTEIRKAYQDCRKKKR